MDNQDFWNEVPDFNTTIMLNKTAKEIEYFSPQSTPIALEIIKLIMCSVGTIVDLLIIYIIIKYKNLQKPVNIFIMNWLICGILFMLVDPSEYRLYALMMVQQIEEEVICIIDSFVVIAGTVETVFMLILMLQWFYDKKAKVDYLNKHYCKIVAAVWIFAFIEFLLTSSPCVYKSLYAQSFGAVFLIFLKFIFFVCFMIMHGMRRCANPFTADASSLAVALITSFVLCWITLILSYIMYEFNNNPLIYLLDIGKMLVYLYPLIAFYLFYKIDPDFAMCTRILFRRNETDAGTNNGRDEIEEGIDINDIPA